MEQSYIQQCRYRAEVGLQEIGTELQQCRYRAEVGLQEIGQSYSSVVIELKQDYKRLEQSYIQQCRYRAEVGLQEMEQSYIQQCRYRAEVVLQEIGTELNTVVSLQS